MGIQPGTNMACNCRADGLRVRDLPPGQDKQGRAPRCSAPMANQHSRSPPGEAGPAPRAGIMCPLTLEHPGRVVSGCSPTHQDEERCEGRCSCCGWSGTSPIHHGLCPTCLGWYSFPMVKNPDGAKKFLSSKASFEDDTKLD